LDAPLSASLLNGPRYFMADETDEKHKEENCHQAAYNSENPQKTVNERLLRHGILL